MIKKLAIVGGGLALLVALLSTTSVGSYATTAISRIRHRVDDSVPVKFKLDDAKEQLARIAPEINQMKYDKARATQQFFSFIALMAPIGGYVLLPSGLMEMVFWSRRIELAISKRAKKYGRCKGIL